MRRPGRGIDRGGVVLGVDVVVEKEGEEKKGRHTGNDNNPSLASAAVSFD